MSSAQTLTAFLEQTGANVRVFDMGRRVVRISSREFQRFEEGVAPYPYPLQRAAWLGLLFWDPQQPAQQVVWFLRFPLDEQGLLVQGARDDFLAQLMEQVLEARKARDEQSGEMHFPEPEGESPYAFKPKEDRMAVFHAKASLAVGQPPSRFYEHARDYLGGAAGWDQWAFVGIQGLADIVVRLEDREHHDLVLGALPHLPEPVLIPLCHCLENEIPDTALCEALRSRLDQALAADKVSPGILAALIRAISGAQAVGLRRELVARVLDSEQATDLEVLAAIAARAWEVLEDADLRLTYLERLVASEGGRDAFLQVVTDLLFMPGLRPWFVESFRDARRSPALAEAIGKLFQPAVPASSANDTDPN